MTIRPLEPEQLTLHKMQTFHRALDQAKGFNQDFIKNVGYMTSEIGESVNAYRILQKAQNEDEEAEAKAHLAEELADCLAYVLKLANVSDVDLEAAYVKKMNHNIDRTW